MAQHTFPKRAEWGDAVLNAGARGFNLLRDFEREMHYAYPDTNHLNFGYFSKDDINSVYTMGWRHFKGSMFDVEDWNSAVGLRFGLRLDVHDNIMYDENYIMIMDRSFRDEIILPARNEEINKVEKSANEAATYVHPDDPEHNRMKDRALELSEATSEKYKVQVRGTPEHSKTKPGDDVF